MAQETSPCSECGFAYVNHYVLWIDSVGDMLSLRVPLHKLPFYRPLLRFVEGIVWILGQIGFSLGRAVGIITLTSDVETAVSTRSKLLWLEATKRGIPMEQLLFSGRPTDTFRIRRGRRQYFFSSLPLSPEVDALRMDDKVIFKEIIGKAGIPVPKSYSASTLASARTAFTEIGIVCVKPRTGSNGRHTYPNVRTMDQLEEAFRSVQQISLSASVEEFIEGNLCRATCVDGKLIGFLESAYPTVTGDGVSTIQELVTKANTQKLEGVDDIDLDGSTIGFIKRRGYELSSVLPHGKKLQLTYRGGVGSGGSNREHGRTIHPSFIEPIEAAARLTKLHIVGFDLIIPDPLAPTDSQRWGFIEANSLPWIDLHAHPYYGTPIDLSSAVWDLWESKHPVRGIR